MKVSGLTMTSASRQLKNRARTTSQVRAQAFARRGFRPAFLEKSKVFSEKEVLSGKGCPRDVKKSDNRQQL
jgi:hypothetical protein